MSIMFSPSDLFDIAIQIERNGAAFYRKAAQQFAEPAVREELLDLALMEEEHEATFELLKERLLGVAPGASDLFESDTEAVAYLESFTQGRIFDMSKDTGPAAGQTLTLIDVLRQAIEKERDSVMFYLGMKNLIPASEGADKIDSIIKQEMSHIGILQRRLIEASQL